MSFEVILAIFVSTLFIALVIAWGAEEYQRDRANQAEQQNRIYENIIRGVIVERDALLDAMNEMAVKEGQARRLLIESQGLHWRTVSELKGGADVTAGDEAKEGREAA